MTTHFWVNGGFTGNAPRPDNKEDERIKFYLENMAGHKFVGSEYTGWQMVDIEMSLRWAYRDGQIAGGEHIVDAQAQKAAA